MKDYLAAQVHGALNLAYGRNVAREYLQARLRRGYPPEGSQLGPGRRRLRPFLEPGVDASLLASENLGRVLTGNG